jgi:hypothetical protein
MTKLRIYKGKTWQPPDVRDELCSILVGIEQATAGCHRFLFAEAEASLDFESSYEAQVVARWVFTTEFMRSLLEIIDDLRFGVLPHAGQADHAVFEQTFLGAYQVALSTAAIWGVWPVLPLLRL